MMPNCPDCRVPLEPRRGRFGPYWACPTPTCTVTHGAHPDGRPLGIPADRGTRQARILAHEAFDRLWKGPEKHMRRGDAYRWLRRRLGLSREECHIARFTAAQCAQVIAVITRHFNTPPRHDPPHT